MADPSFLLETSRLQITHLLPNSPSHSAFIAALWNTPEFIASFGGKVTKITTPDAAQALIASRFASEYARNGYGTFLISLKPSPSTMASGTQEEVSSTFVGTVSLSKGDAANSFKVPDLGFAVLSAYLRQEYAVEAAQGILDWYETGFGTREVLGLHDKGNLASRGVFEKLGFVDMGVRPLKAFGEGVEGTVWIRRGMSEDLSLYGI